MISAINNINYSLPAVTIIIPCGPGAKALLDTLESIVHYCQEPYDVILVDDCTVDGTYESIITAKQPNWHILRNKVRYGTARLVHSLCIAYNYFLENLSNSLVLRLDQDALLIGHGVINDAFDFMLKNPRLGIFGVYETDYNRQRSYAMHEKLINKEIHWLRRLLFQKPSWYNIFKLAIERGYRRGDNVFGGAYFITRDCLVGIKALGGLNVPYKWNSRMQEDVYFSMAAVAAGFGMGQFAAPDGPLCLEWRGLPYPAAELHNQQYKIVHSVDKGKNTGPLDNNGQTAREFFREVRQRERFANNDTAVR